MYVYNQTDCVCPARRQLSPIVRVPAADAGVIAGLLLPLGP